MHVKNSFRFSLTLLFLLSLLSILLATSALGSGRYDTPTIISLESVGKPAAKEATSDTTLDQAMQNDSNAAANANMAIQQTVPITAARTMGEISTAGEVDEYSFDATAGDRVYVALQSSSSSATSNDTLIEILAQDGTSVLERDDDDGSFSFLSSSIAGLEMAQTGSYKLNVRHASNNKTISPYYLHFQTQSGTPSAETEPNDNTTNAQTLPASGWVAGVISTASDKDLYQLDLNAGDNLYIALDMDPERDGTTFNGRAGLGLLSNTFVVSNDDATTSPNSEAFFLTIKESGTYFVYVDAVSGAGASATYHLSVQVEPKVVPTTACETYSSSNLPLTLGNSAPATANLTVPILSSVKDINLNLELTHNSLSDLQVTLNSPTGQSVTLLNNLEDASSNIINIKLDDEAWLPAGAAEVWDGVAYQPTVGGQLATFNESNAQGTWSLVSHDARNNVGQLSVFEMELCYEQVPNITLQQTVGTTPGVCAASNEITVNPGTTVYYCYTVENTGMIPFTSHNLQDDQLGSLLSNEQLTLNVGQQHEFISSGTVIKQNTINNATWSATDGTKSASATASAKVNAPAVNIPSIEFQVTVGTQPETCASSTSLSVLSGTRLYYCYRVSNNGTVVFTQHDLFDNKLGKILNDEIIILEPGQSHHLIREAVLTESKTNEAFWTAYGNNNQSAEYFASAEVTILTPALSFSKTVGTKAGTCATTDTITVTTGSQVHYCYRLHNAGDVPLTSHHLVDDQLGTLLITDSRNIAPSESYSLTHSTTLTQSVVNHATWTAQISPTLTLTHTDMATVTVLAPIIGMNPHAMQGTQNLNQVISHTIMISNSGNMALEWTLIEEAEATTGACAATDIPWLELTRPSGSIESGVTDEIIIDFDTSFIAPNVYSATLCIQNNDPTHPQMRVPLTLTVLAVPTALELAQLSANDSTYWPWTWLVIGSMLLLMASVRWHVSKRPT